MTYWNIETKRKDQHCGWKNEVLFSKRWTLLQGASTDNCNVWLSPNHFSLLDQERYQQARHHHSRSKWTYRSKGQKSCRALAFHTVQNSVPYMITLNIPKETLELKASNKLSTGFPKMIQRCMVALIEWIKERVHLKPK